MLEEQEQDGSKIKDSIMEKKKLVTIANIVPHIMMVHDYSIPVSLNHCVCLIIRLLSCIKSPGGIFSYRFYFDEKLIIFEGISIKVRYCGFFKCDLRLGLRQNSERKSISFGTICVFSPQTFTLTTNAASSIIKKR